MVNSEAEIWTVPTHPNAVPHWFTQWCHRDYSSLNNKRSLLANSAAMKAISTFF